MSETMSDLRRDCLAAYADRQAQECECAKEERLADEARKIEEGRKARILLADSVRSALGVEIAEDPEEGSGWGECWIEGIIVSKDRMVGGKIKAVMACPRCGQPLTSLSVHDRADFGRALACRPSPDDCPNCISRTEDGSHLGETEPDAETKPIDLRLQDE